VEKIWRREKAEQVRKVSPA